MVFRHATLRLVAMFALAGLALLLNVTVVTAQSVPADSGNDSPVSDSVPIAEDEAFEALPEGAPADETATTTSETANHDVPQRQRPRKMKRACAPGICRRVAAGDMPFMIEIHTEEPLAGQTATTDAVTVALARHLCGGALIAPEWVLTAAHCLYRDDMKKADMIRHYRIRFGVNDLLDSGKSFRIKDYFVRRYNPKYIFKDDIALIQLYPSADDLAWRKRNVARLPPRNFDLAPGTKVKSAGWGRTSNRSLQNATRYNLQSTLDVISNAQCHAEFRNRLSKSFKKEELPDTVICAQSPDSQHCKGDSGSPLVTTGANPMLVGIVSWTKQGCAVRGDPGAYTRTSRYLNWIWNYVPSLKAGINHGAR